MERESWCTCHSTSDSALERHLLWQIVTCIPTRARAAGGLFEVVACPHYLAEMVIYTGFWVMCGYAKLPGVILCWVVRRAPLCSNGLCTRCVVYSPFSEGCLLALLLHLHCQPIDVSHAMWHKQPRELRPTAWVQVLNLCMGAHSTLTWYHEKFEDPSRRQAVISYVY
jgi:hypothetical protein